MQALGQAVDEVGRRARVAADASSGLARETLDTWTEGAKLITADPVGVASDLWMDHTPAGLAIQGRTEDAAMQAGRNLLAGPRMIADAAKSAAYTVAAPVLGVSNAADILSGDPDRARQGVKGHPSGSTLGAPIRIHLIRPLQDPVIRPSRDPAIRPSRQRLPGAPKRIHPEQITPVVVGVVGGVDNPSASCRPARWLGGLSKGLRTTCGLVDPATPFAGLSQGAVGRPWTGAGRPSMGCPWRPAGPVPSTARPASASAVRPTPTLALPRAFESSRRTPPGRGRGAATGPSQRWPAAGLRTAETTPRHSGLR